MRGLGIFFVIAGVIWALVAYNMDTTVTTESQTYGSGEYAIRTPSVTVNNLGLMETRRNNLMFAGLTILIGVVLIGFGSVSRKTTADVGLKACPFCAEPIQPSALKCRYCSSDLPDSFRASSAPLPSRTADARLGPHFALIQQRYASIATYKIVASALGGTLAEGGSFTDKHYLVSLGGVETRIDKYGDLANEASAT